VRKVRLLAADFRASFDDMARQSELDDLRKEVQALRDTKLTDALGPVPTFDEIGQGLEPGVPHRYDDTQDKLDAGFSPEDAALPSPDPAHSILPPVEAEAAPSAAKPRARSKAKSKAASAEATTPESEA
jgi:sec-independent protein translocase protein TatB